MARKKVTLRYILDKKSRFSTSKKRREGLRKKAEELAIMCNAKACVLVYGEGEAVPQVFPSPAEAVPILNRYKNMPEGNFKKTVNHEGFLNQHFDKLQAKGHKLQGICEDNETRILLHKAMLRSNLSSLDGLNIEDLTNVGRKLEVILQSMGERITKISGQPPLFQPQEPYITNTMDMGSPAMYHTPPPAPYVTDYMHMKSPSTYQAPPPAPYITHNMDMGSSMMYPAASPVRYGTSGMDMGPPTMFKAPPQQQEDSLHMMRYGGDLNALVYSGHNSSGHNDTNTSIVFHSGDIHPKRSFEVGFGWQFGGADPEASSSSPFPPITLPKQSVRHSETTGKAYPTRNAKGAMENEVLNGLFNNITWDVASNSRHVIPPCFTNCKRACLKHGEGIYLVKC
ncbi:MADS-box transcription factor 34-like [Triticum dicoccoides]|uniref:MADS-box transcription factor 34-like n=1 Tax=Triticum dicoccoides TaxID=85692 RepID=UPI001891B574|nr:MADS-box transcription factor 34-like [Triticum dicoccoides]